MSLKFHAVIGEAFSEVDESKVYDGFRVLRLKVLGLNVDDY